MKGMIFAAGLGTRLRPLTDHLPKALVEVGGMTMLERTVRALSDIGCGTIVVNVHHFADMLRDYLREHGNFGCDIRVSDESALLLDTGGGVLAARRWLDGREPIVVHNADIATAGLRLADMVAAHAASRDAVATLLVSERTTQRKLLFDGDMRLRGWTRSDTGQLRPGTLTPAEAATLTPLPFGGIHVLSPAIFDGLQRYADAHGPVFSIVNYYIDSCATTPIYGYLQREPYEWHDIGKPASLQAARDCFAT